MPSRDPGGLGGAQTSTTRPAPRSQSPSNSAIADARSEGAAAPQQTRGAGIRFTSHHAWVVGIGGFCIAILLALLAALVLLLR